MELHRQFVEVGLAKGGRAGELDFLSLANRARTRGHNPGGLLRRLLELGVTDWITTADEEVATRRMREVFQGPTRDQTRKGRGPAGGASVMEVERGLSEEQLFVEKCCRVGQVHRIDPFRVAELKRQWSRDRWERAYWDYQNAQHEAWYPAGEAEA